MEILITSPPIWNRNTYDKTNINIDLAAAK